MVFDENVGSDDRVVFGPGPVQIMSGGGGGFDVAFGFPQPFFYNPTNGNLLVDFRIYTGAGTIPGGIAILDAYDVRGDSVSSVYAYDTVLPASGQATTLGLATLFVVTPIPEPSTWALLGMGLLVVGAGWKRRKGGTGCH
jgi:hypothetical protein